MNELIEYLLNYAFDHGIGYKLVHADPYGVLHVCGGDPRIILLVFI